MSASCLKARRHAVGALSRQPRSVDPPTSTTALTSITTRYVLSCTTGAVTIASTDRIYLWVGANITAAGGGNTKAELSIEGTNGSTDSLLTVQLPR